jgi:peptidoglycan hydrolase CwlO-like protein
MECIQLEFSYDDKTVLEQKLEFVQKQLTETKLSLDKTRKCLFAESRENKKECVRLSSEVNELKQMIMRLTNEKTHWIYGQEGALFDVKEHCG